MRTTTKTLHILVFLSTLSLLTVTTSGCHWRELLEEASTPMADGTTPAERLTDNIPKIISNPANPFPWIEVLGTLGALVVTGFTGKQILSKHSKTKAAKAAVATIESAKLIAEAVVEASSKKKTPQIPDPATTTKA